MAVVTDRLKKQVISFIQNDLDSDANIYIGIGRSEDWNDSDIAPTTERTKREERNFRNGLQSIKKVIDASFVVPRYNWSSGAVYSAYDDAQIGYPTQTYYVMNDNNEVFIVLQQSKNTDGTAKVSTVQPTGNTSGTPFQTADGYIWKFLYSISAVDANKFVAANFIPVKKATSADSDAAGVTQLAAQNAAVVGQIIGIAVDSGGTGYTSTPSISITGNGTGGNFTVTTDGGVVTKVEVDSTGGFGSGYTNAGVTLSTSGSTKPAKIRAILGTPLGLGGDPRDDLKSTSFMFQVKPTGTETGDFIVGNDFRQVGLIKGMKRDSDGGIGSDFDSDTGIVLKKLHFASQTNNFTVDKTIQGASSQAKALVDRVDSAAFVFFHQTEETGFKSFDSGENITEVDGTGAGALVTGGGSSPVQSGEALPHTGDILYIDNRASVSRSTDQTEDIKIVIQI